MFGFTQKRKKNRSFVLQSRKMTHTHPHTHTPAPKAVRLLRARLIKYEQCRDAKCTPEWVMDKELTNYSKSVKSKCGILKNLKNISDKEMRAHAKCTSKLYDASRYHQMAKKQTRCVKKNCNHMRLFYPVRMK
jgi:hypothetical protein